MRKFYIISILLVTGILFYTCHPERNYIEEGDARLQFSLDTVYFDTIFTTIGTTTKSFRVYNPHSRFIKIDAINLAGGSSSVFRINVDGMPGVSFEEFEIAPKDSMYVFVEATLDPNQSPDILRIQDSITFSVNGNLQDIDLVAWGQDVHLLRDSVVAPNTIWTADKPYLILNRVIIDTLETLTIQEGVKIYLHRDAYIHVLGSLKIYGDTANPVIIQGDRLEDFYSDLPGQWGFIFFQNGSYDNVIDHARILNGTIGLFVNSPMYSANPVLALSNSEINQMSYDGILAQATSIKANNTVIGDCGNSCVELLYEGSYAFTHCTFANYWRTGFSNRKNPAVFVANYYAYINEEEENEVLIESRDIEQASFTNCIIYGSKNNELHISKSADGQLNYTFDYVLARFEKDKVFGSLGEDPYDYDLDPGFSSNIILNKDPLFDSLRVSYELDSLSPAIDAGKVEYALSFPYDKKGDNRLGDKAPDLGAFERIEE